MYPKPNAKIGKIQNRNFKNLISDLDSARKMRERVLLSFFEILTGTGFKISILPNLFIIQGISGLYFLMFIL